jgi:ABC-type transporter MlaC component
MLIVTLTLGALVVAQPAPTPRQAVEEAHQKVQELVVRVADEAALKGEVVGVLDALIDWAAFSSRTLTKDIWSALDEAKQRRFIERYRQLITKRYAKHFEPKRHFRAEVREAQAPAPGATTAWVRTTIFVETDKGEPVGVDVDYLFVPSKASGQGGWAVADLDTDGVSRALSYRKSFSRIYQQEGFEALLAAIDRNLKQK